MLTIICITALAYFIMGKDFNPLLEKIQNTDWRAETDKLFKKLRPYAIKVGRAAATPLLQLWYVLRDANTSTKDKVLIYAALVYTILPMDLIPRRVYRLLGVLDDGAAVLFVYKKIKDKITPEIMMKVEDTLNDWFGVEYEVIG
jgi:uncharacterized membrane protein YkvA (DUF1232 family)